MKPRPLAVIRNRRLNSVALLVPLRSVQFSSAHLNTSHHLPCPVPSYLKPAPTRQLHPKKLAMSNFLSELKITHCHVDDILFSKRPQCEHLSPHGTSFFREEDTPIPFTSPHSPSNSAWAHPRGCHGPVERLKHRISKEPDLPVGQSHLLPERLAPQPQET